MTIRHESLESDYDARCVRYTLFLLTDHGGGVTLSTENRPRPPNILHATDHVTLP